MTLISIFSDAHLDYLSSNNRKEFFKKLDEFIADHPSKVCIIAGDTSELRSYHTHDIYREFCRLYPHVVAVFGNHEYNSITLKDGDHKAKVLMDDFPNLHILNNDSVTIDGQKFLGGVGWYPEPKGEAYNGRQRFFDYRTIKDFEPEVYDRNARFRDLCATAGHDDIIISHHPPSWKSVHKMFEGSSNNCFFINDIEDVIVEKQPKLFVSGHVHNHFNYKIGKTLCYINPLGYKDEGANNLFWEQIIIDI